MADRTLIPGTWRADGARPFLHRAVVLITGQGDELATPFAGCTGGCHQGDLPCDCELSCDIGLDATRPFPAPPPLPDDVRSRVMRRTYVVIAAVSSVFAGLIALAGSETMR